MGIIAKIKQHRAEKNLRQKYSDWKIDQAILEWQNTPNVSTARDMLTFNEYVAYAYATNTLAAKAANEAEEAAYREWRQRHVV